MSRTAGSVPLAGVLLLTAMGRLAVGLSAMTSAYAGSSRGRTPSASAYAAPLGAARALVLIAVAILLRGLREPRSDR